MNKHNITLVRMCEILDSDMHWRVLRVRTPKLVYKYFYDKFIVEFNTLFSAEDNAILFSDTTLLDEIFHEVFNTIPIIVDNLKMGQCPEGMYEMIRDNYGYHELDLYQMIEAFLNEQARLINKYKELRAKKENEPNKNESENKTFARAITIVEGNLGGMPIDRNMSMHMFHAKYEESLAKIKEYEKLKNKI